MKNIYVKLSRLALMLLINASIFLCSLIAAILFGEWFFRTYMPSPNYGGGIRPAFYSNLFEYDEVLGWKGVPNLRTPYFSKDFHITVTHDNAGYRNLSPPYIKGKNNLLLLGDSYAWGWGVEDNETATAVFNSSNKSNLYNLGIAGYGTDQEYLALQKHLSTHPSYQYNGVILLFYMNDLDDNSASERYGYPKPQYVANEKSQLILRNVPVPKKDVPQNISVTQVPTPDYWTEKSHLLNGGGKILLELLLSKKSNDIPPSMHEDKMTSTELSEINLSADLLSEIKQYCSKNGMFFHVVFLMTQDTQQHHKYLLENLESQIKTRNIDHSYFYSKKFPRTDLWLDAHYTPYGQALLADHIADVINKTDEKTH